MATQWKLKGFNCSVTYTVPVPAGFTAEKQTVVVGQDVPKDQIASTIAAIHMMMRDIAEAFAEADPYKGWAPFVYGTSVQPDWEKINVP